MALMRKRWNCPKWIFFSKKKKHKKKLMYLLAPFIPQNFKRILRADPELSESAIFGHKMADLSWTNFFWYKPLLLLSSSCWTFSLRKFTKTSYNRSKFLRISSVSEPKMVHLPPNNLFLKLLISFSSNY